ncbi:MAG TPA: hypothetical protein VEX37_15755 [Thermomicrobiales bacterium]|nr:hypothetical protein [Thermomicrobiales bacterium]
MNRDYDTTEGVSSGDAGDAPVPGDPVGRVNLPVEPEPDLVLDDVATGDTNDGPATMNPDGDLREKVLYGLLAGVLMVLAMVVILQGVFEQKMPV